ncbi:MAG TPA: ATP-dependent DNA helicase RecG [Planctomycetota bacterium]|nr:ATP-dependent DNA helicase RecG [Planctomycetota bacterium]
MTNDPSTDLLARPLQYFKGVGPKRAELLARLDLHTVRDLLLYFPITHKDRASVTPIMALKIGKEANIVAQIIDVTCKRFNGKEQIVGHLMDAQGGRITAVWWNPWIADKLTPYGWGFFSGKVTSFVEKKQLSNAEFEIFDDEESETPRMCSSAPESMVGPSFGRIVPIYNLRPKHRLPDGQEAPEIRINQNALRKIVWQVLEAGAAELVRDQLPDALRVERKLMPLAEAVRQFHFPDSFEKAAVARRRLVFEELFIISLGVALRRAQIERAAVSARMPLVPAIVNRINARMPFTLTAAQQQAFQQIAADMSRATPMNRLLQGDVGSGKTAVAVAALLLCVAHGHQAALLAPTEALAVQHHRTLTKLLENSRVEIRLLRGGAKESARAEFLEKLSAGAIHIAIGTHALLEADVKFKSLALAVVDEQHKFGVAQRMSLRAKGRAPHVLVMTATPIPRTLTLTLYGDLDVSVLNEMPPGRGEIVTKWLDEADRPKAYRCILDEAKKGHSTYIVLPRILGENPDDEDVLPSPLGGEAAVPPSPLGGEGPGVRGRRAKHGQQSLWTDVKGAEQEFKRMKEHLPTLRVELLHGRLAPAEKQRVLDLLAAGKIDVLVSTQVIEVGIDLPTATVMLIENAERFGLSALHQLRGRVGRSERKSYCLFFSDTLTDDAEARLKAFEKTRDGFRIAETDFKLRGPGQFFGTRQSGMPELKIADLLQDVAILSEARDAAFKLVRADSTLAQPENSALKARVREALGTRLGLVDVG